MKRLLWINDPHMNFLTSEAIQNFFTSILQQKADFILVGGDIGEAKNVVGYLGHWLFGGGEHLDEIDDPMWSKYMMAGPRMRPTCAKHLEDDAKVRASLVRASQDSSDVHAGSYEVFIKIHMDMVVSGYTTGYELLHQSAREDGDFNILGGVVVTRSDDGDVTIKYLVKYRWNEYAHPNPDEPADEARVSVVKLAAFIAANGFVDPLGSGHFAYKKIGNDFHMTIVWHAESTVTITKDGAIRSEHGWPFE
jgi:hypothetical protein